MIRFFIRIAVLALAAFGAKSLYERFVAPNQDQLRQTADQFIDRTSTAAREVGNKVTGAAGDVASTVETNAADVKATAQREAQNVGAAATQAKNETVSTLQNS
ncbi:MAG TPA: hypothetical protein VFZ17_05720 [Acidimicrobiia bacterium]|nr:hypothetical protein [Acidimicrobiia bacterium]